MSEDISGFTGCLSSSDSLVSEKYLQTDDDESSAGQDGFNEVGEVVVRFKAQPRGADFVNEAFEDSEDLFLGSLGESDDEKSTKAFSFKMKLQSLDPQYIPIT